MSWGKAAVESSDLAIKLQANGFKNVSIMTIKGPDLYNREVWEQGTHFMDLSFFLFNNTSWTQEKVLAHLRKIAATYNQKNCQILIRQAVIIMADPYNGITNVDWATVYLDTPSFTGTDLEIAKHLPPEVPKPAIFLMESSSQGYSAWSAPRAVTINSFRKPLMNTVWVSHRIETGYGDQSLKPTDDYDPIAHEIAHVLGNFATHTIDDEPNIMNDDITKVNGTILPYQCERMETFNMVFKIDKNLTADAK
jgi:hypothetical protein